MQVSMKRMLVRPGVTVPHFIVYHEKILNKK